MSRINCHSAFKHYEMFHNMGGDVINIGSNNTTIFNMGAGFGNFGGASFWSGLGYGLGNGLGSIFGSLFGGNMGGFGNFGFGMSPWAGMGMFYNSMGAGGYGGSNRVDSHSDGKGKVKDDSISNKNIDYAKLNKLFERKNNLLEAKEPKLTDLEKLKNDIDKLAKDLDGNDDGNDNDYIKQLKRGLDDKINELKGKESANKPETKVDGADNKAKVAPADETGNVKDDAAVGSTKFDDKLKQAGDDKGALKELALDKSLTPEQRAKAKAKFYYPGYSNVTADDLKDETKAKALLETLKTVVDTSDKYDFTNLKNVTATKSEGKWVITADSTFAKGSLAKLKYTFKETVDGELIFVGTKETQHYVLQKNDQGVHLMQYDYHLGHGSYDVKVAG